MTNKYQFIQKILDELFQIDCAILTGQFDSVPGYDPPRYPPKILANKIHATKSDLTNMQIVSPEQNIYFGILPVEENLFWVLGPIGGEFLTEQQVWSFRFQFQIRTEQYHIPRYTFFRIETIMNLANYLLTGKLPNEAPKHIDGLEADDAMKEYAVIDHQLRNELEERARYPFQYEQEYFQMVENGEADKLLEEMLEARNRSPIEALQKVGVIAKDSDFKQMEYMTVTSVALASRAAIRGNARPDVCYDLSDLFLQKISVAKNIREIYDISTQVAYRFAKEVEKEKALRADNPIVEHCKTYIAKHLYSKFTVEQMADDLSFSRTYLSSLFKSETGQTLRDYIQERRLKAAARLLRYSDIPIGQLSDYLQFSSPSRFSKFFKRSYHFTPEEYRNQNRLME